MTLLKSCENNATGSTNGVLVTFGLSIFFRQTKVRKIQELLEESDFGKKTSRAIEHVFLHSISMRVLLA